MMLSFTNSQTACSASRHQQRPCCSLARPPRCLVTRAAAAAGGAAGSTEQAVQMHAAPAASTNGSTTAAAAAAQHQPQQQQQQAHGPVRLPVPEVSGKRVAVVKRQTKETSVEVRLNIDGTGQCVANTPVGFFNHMLDQLASHGLFDVYVEAQGDTWIDDHHTVEDIALALGSAFSQALGDRKGIHR